MYVNEKFFYINIIINRNAFLFNIFLNLCQSCICSFKNNERFLNTVYIYLCLKSLRFSFNNLIEYMISSFAHLNNNKSTVEPKVKTK